MKSDVRVKFPRPPRTILVARHGETEWNRLGRWQGTTDIQLSDVGRAQARALGERLRDDQRANKIARVYASHLSRAVETAQIAAAVLGLEPPAIDPRLRERGYGCFEGLTREECEVRHPDVWRRYLADRRLVPPDAEPQAQIVARVSAALREIALSAAAGEERKRENEGGGGGQVDGEGEGEASGEGEGPLLVISHGGTIRTFIHAELGLLLPPLANGAIYRLSFDGTRFVSAEPY